MIIDGNKKCSICGIVKDISEFNKDSHASDGYRSECRSCRAVKHLKRRSRDLKRMKNYDKKHKTERSNYNRQYYLEHKGDKNG